VNTTQDVTAAANASAVLKNLVLPVAEVSAYNSTKGIEYVPLQDITKSFMITSCGNSNLYLQNFEKTTGLDHRGCGSLWAYDDLTDTIYSDGSGRIAYFYSDEMSKLGVSRLRIGSKGQIPLSGQFVSFLPYAQQDSTGGEREGTKIYLPTDDEGKFYGTVVCFYPDKTLPPKVFLANDKERAVSMLKSPDIKYSVTDGDVADCSILSFGQGDDVAGAAWDGSSQHEEWDY
jgi:hypothetical protein